MHESLIATMVPPARATSKPTRRGGDKGSLRKMGASKATHNGLVVTSTTELATLVNSNERIQVAKCRASSKPARATIQAAALTKNALLEIDVIAEVR